MTARKVFANIDINIYFFVLTLNFEIGDLDRFFPSGNGSNQVGVKIWILVIFGYFLLLFGW